jgi:fibronectin-binding autotransporter adhesin
VGELVVTGGRRGGRSPLTVTDLLTMYDGRLGSPNTVTAARGGTTTIGALGQLSIEGGLPLDGQHTVRIEGSATWSLGDITLCDGSLLQNLGTMELPSNGASTADCGSGVNRFVNEAAATLVKLATGVDDSITVPFENQGTVEVNGASLAIGAAPVSSPGDAGTWQTLSGAIVRFDADRTFLSTSPVTGDGGMQTNGGTQSFAPGTSIDSLLHGGTIQGSVTLDEFLLWAGGTSTGAGTMTLAPGSTSSGAGTLTNGYTLVNQGNWSIADDELLVCNGSTLRNESALTITSNATSIGDCGSGPNLFLNTSTGTVTKASGIESYIDVPFTNNGTLSVSAGRLLLIRDDLTNLTGTTLTGGIYDLPGFVLVSDAAGGVTTNAADLRPSGSGQHFLNGSGGNALASLTTNAAAGRIELRTGTQMVVAPSFTNHGEIAGVGTLDATTVSNSGTIAPGLSPGILTIDGDFGQTSGGVLRVELNGTTVGTGYDRLAVTGTASLGGTLQLITGFSPTSTDTFSVLTAASRTGSFSAVTGEPSPGQSYVPTYNPTNVTVAPSSAPALPTVSIADASMAEGSSGGFTNLTFTVSLSAPSASTVTVNWSTADGTAVQPSDYTASSGTVTFVPDDTSETITVPVRGDTDVEPNETFQVNLSTPSNATIADGSATGTIQNDDVAPPAGPTVSVGDAAIWEGDTKIRTVLFPVTLDVAATSTVSVNYRIVAGSATGGKVDIDNYSGAVRTLTFKPAAGSGKTVVNKTIAVKVFGDTALEGDENFTLELVSANGLTIDRGVGTGTIYDDEGGSGVRVGIGSVSTVEGDGGTVKMSIRLTLSSPAVTNSSIKLTASNLSALSGVDYKLIKPKTISFKPGNFQKSVVVTLIPNTTAQADRSMQLALSDPVNLTVQGTGIGIGTILDDD